MESLKLQFGLRNTKQATSGVPLMMSKPFWNAKEEKFLLERKQRMEKAQEEFDYSNILPDPVEHWELQEDFEPSEAQIRRATGIWKPKRKI